jgi:hypothetical protein
LGRGEPGSQLAITERKQLIDDDDNQDSHPVVIFEQTGRLNADDWDELEKPSSEDRLASRLKGLLGKAWSVANRFVRGTGGETKFLR